MNYWLLLEQISPILQKTESKEKQGRKIWGTWSLEKQVWGMLRMKSRKEQLLHKESRTCQTSTRDGLKGKDLFWQFQRFLQSFGSIIVDLRWSTASYRKGCCRTYGGQTERDRRKLRHTFHRHVPKNIFPLIKSHLPTTHPILTHQRMNPLMKLGTPWSNHHLLPPARKQVFNNTSFFKL